MRIDKELHKETFILAIELLVGVYGQRNFYYIEIWGKVVTSGIPESFENLKMMIRLCLTLLRNAISLWH